MDNEKSIIIVVFTFLFVSMGIIILLGINGFSPSAVAATNSSVDNPYAGSDRFFEGCKTLAKGPGTSCFDIIVCKIDGKVYTCIENACGYRGGISCNWGDPQ